MAVSSDPDFTRTDAATWAAVAFLVISLLLLIMAAEKRFIPGSAACIALGAVVGALLGPTGWAEQWGVDEKIAYFDRDLFYYVLRTSHSVKP
jgi:MFS superfamily sulfate permease-like transporter